MITQRTEGADLEVLCTLFSTRAKKGIQGRAAAPESWFCDARRRLALIIREDRQARRQGGRIAKARQAYIANNDLDEIRRLDAYQAEQTIRERARILERERVSERKSDIYRRHATLKAKRRLRRMFEGKTKRVEGLRGRVGAMTEQLRLMDRRRAVLLDGAQIMANAAFLDPIRARELERKFKRISKNMDADEALALAAYLRSNFK